MGTTGIHYPWVILLFDLIKLFHVLDVRVSNPQMHALL